MKPPCRCCSFKGQADYGYCASKKQTYYGFQAHLLVSVSSVMTSFTLTPANGSEREALWEMVAHIQGMLIGDKGYLSDPLRHELLILGFDLQTSLRANMNDTRYPQGLRLLVVETT